MKVVILAGGLGSRISEESMVRPKPMIEIGGKPILWHIMKTYSHFGFRDFVICLGYRGYMISEYFAHYHLHMSDLTVNLENNAIEIHRSSSEPWKVTLIDTGETSMTGGRIKRIKPYVDNQTFMLTYGDGLSNIDLKKLLEFHRSHGKSATLTAVKPPGRFGLLSLEGQDRVRTFSEKPAGDGDYMNGGFFVCEPKVFDYLAGDTTIWEREPLERLATDGELMAYKHDSFWAALDTLRDKNQLEAMWNSGKAPWRVWG
ncbi:MAG TPA: glucose-1-phosphate cytidylyltransferase [Thermoplasmata archaeon]|jgi:glucose-1-phosphate cytidylyltransferase